MFLSAHPVSSVIAELRTHSLYSLMTQYFTITINITCRIASHIPTYPLSCHDHSPTFLFATYLTSLASYRRHVTRVSACPFFVWLACIFLPRYSPSPNQSLFAHKRLPRFQPPPKTTGHALPIYVFNMASPRRTRKGTQHLTAHTV